MADSKEKEKEAAVDVKSPSATLAPSSRETTLKVPRKKSKGEKWFDGIVYSGLNYWVNLISSILMADYFRNLGGKKYLEQTSQFVGKVVEKTGMVTQKKAADFTNPLLRTLALLIGGTAVLFPIKIMEDKKREIVHSLNEKLGVDQTAEDGHKLTADEIYIEKEQPKQTWWNAIKRRIYAIATVLATGFVINHTFKEKGAQRANGEDVATNFLVKKANKAFDHIPGGELFKKDTAQRWLNIAALDSFYTWVTASVIKLTNGAKRAQMPNEIHEYVPAENGLMDTKDESTVAQDRSSLKAKKHQPTGSYTELAQQEPVTLSVAP